MAPGRRPSRTSLLRHKLGAFSTRAFWMRRANAALAELGSPCPFSAFSSVIVNHTAPGLGELVCIGVNTNRQTGDPTLHAEIAAIHNCSAILTDPSGPYKLSPVRALDAFAQLSLYTNVESCPMCASAIRWAGFREYIYGTSIETLIQQGWRQIRIPSLEIFKQSFELPDPARLIGEILTNETDRICCSNSIRTIRVPRVAQGLRVLAVRLPRRRNSNRA
ncbi:cytidine deaminase-like protein [Mycena latifolia]|nr:cytidine deaminase-like protein [Mycena latifolia]